MWPPFTRAAGTPSSTSWRAARPRSSTVRSVSPVSTSASGTLAVTSVERRSSRSPITATAASSSSRAPPLATITVSRTTGSAACASMASATTVAMAALASIPILMASIARSSRTVSICARTMPASTGQTRVTPCVFWAVSAVMALVPNTPCAANVFRSAWMPAPPPESLPAIVIAARMRVSGAIGTAKHQQVLIAKERLVADQPEAGLLGVGDDDLRVEPFLERGTGPARTVELEVDDAEAAVGGERVGDVAEHGDAIVRAELRIRVDEQDSVEVGRQAGIAGRPENRLDVREALVGYPLRDRI